MLRKLLFASMIGVLGLFGASGVATAAPGDPTSYPPPPAETTTSGTPIVITTPSTTTPATETTTTASTTATTTFATETVSVSGGGMLPGEQVSVSVVYSGPSGLRANSALRAVNLKAAGTIVTADANGNFSAGVTIEKGRSGTIVATGLTSGHTVSFAIAADGSVGGGSGGGGSGGGGNGETTGSAGGAGDTTTVPYQTEVSTENIAAAPGDNADNGGLAYTGASIAGPLTMGAAAVLVGLAFLFFGTRLSIRRRRPYTRH